MIHHSPQWYSNHCKSENVNPLLRKQLRGDCSFIGADYDKSFRHIERIPTYEDQWDMILRSSDQGWDSIKSEMMDVMMREAEPDRKRYERRMLKEQRAAKANRDPDPSSEWFTSTSDGQGAAIPVDLGPCPAGGIAKLAWMRARMANAISALAVDDFKTQATKPTRKHRINSTKTNMSDISFSLPNDVASLQALLAEAQKKIDQIKALDGYRPKLDALATEAGYSDTKEFLIALDYKLVTEKAAKAQASASTTGGPTKQKGRVPATEAAEMEKLYDKGNGLSISDIAKKHNRNEAPVKKALGITE
jgi:hypothetical protein